MLLVCGLRGRRVNDHPICRRCRFDLAGVYPVAGVCPECGRNLNAPKAIQKGARRKRKVLLIIGILSVMVSLTFAGLVASQMFRSTRPNQHKPVWLLLHEAAGQPDARAHAALDELFDRQINGALSNSAESRAIKRALRYQRDRSKPWRTGWGRLIEHAWDNGKLSDAEKKQYAEQAFALVMVSQPQMQVDGPVAVQLRVEPRVGEGWMFTLLVSHLGMKLGDTPVPSNLTELVTGAMGSMYYRTDRSVTPPPTTPYEIFGESEPGTGLAAKRQRVSGEPGTRALRSRWTMLVLESDMRNKVTASSQHMVSQNAIAFDDSFIAKRLDPVADLAEIKAIRDRSSAKELSGIPIADMQAISGRHLELTTTVQVLGPDEELFELVTDPLVIAETQSKLRPAITIQRDARPGSIRLRMGSHRAALQLPVFIASDVYLQRGEQEVYLGRWAYDTQASWAVAEILKQDIPDTMLDGPVNVVFRLNRHLALMKFQPGVDRLLGEEIVIEGVTIEPATAPQPPLWTPPSGL